MLIIIEDNNDNVTTVIARIQIYSQFIDRVILNKDRTELEVFIKGNMPINEFFNMQSDIKYHGTIKVESNFHFIIKINKD